jgi:hypothetical protein
MVLKHKRKTLGHAAVFLVVTLAAPAISKDFGILTRILCAAFLAEQGVALCTVADPAFASETSGPRGYMRDYATHVKAEVTAGLNETEAPWFAQTVAEAADAITLPTSIKYHRFQLTELKATANTPISTLITP